MGKTNRIKLTPSDIAFVIVNYAIQIFCFLIVAYPLLYIVSASVSEANAVVSGKVWLLPVGFSLKAYKTVFENKSIMTGYSNTFQYTVVGTLFNLLLTTLAAYVLSRKKLYGRKVITWFFMFTMFFSGGLIPTYIQMKNLHIIDTFWAMIIPGGISITNMIIMRTFFQNSIPEELYESAYLDGCGDAIMMLLITIPLSKAIFAVMTLYYAVFHWNDYFNCLIYINSPTRYSLQFILRELLMLNQMDQQLMAGSQTVAAETLGLFELLRYAMIVVASLPVLCLYPFVQKHFVKGVMIGSIKG